MAETPLTLSPSPPGRGWPLSVAKGPGEGRVLIPLLLLLFIACHPKPEPSAKEKTYPMTATIVSRDPAQNTINLDNKEVSGVMEAMRMDYAVRGAKVQALPADGTPVDVTLHEQDGRYWVTDIKPRR